MAPCDVCCSEVASVVACPSCTYASCTACLKRYLLQTPHDAHCMSCRVEWHRDFLGRSLPKTWLLGPYKTWRESVLLEREKLLLPETQVMARNYAAVRQLQVEREASRQESARLQQALSREYQKQRDLEHRISSSERRGYAVEPNTNNYRFQAIEERASRPSNAPRVAGPCPADGCKGYVMTPDHTCGTCSAKVCAKCMELEGAGHECDPTAIKTYELLKKDSRPCPGCGAFIHKIEGCYQMWCTQCHVAFNFRTGEIDKGVVHNPHYFQHMRGLVAAGGNAGGGGGAGGNAGGGGGAGGGARCGGCGAGDMPPLEGMMKRLSKINGLTDLQTEQVMEWVRSLTHVRYVQLGRLRTATRRRDPRVGTSFYKNDRAHYMNVPPLTAMRIQFLLNDLSEEEWALKLQRAEKAHTVARASLQLVEAFVEAGTDLIGRLDQALVRLDRRAPELVAETLGALHTLKQYADQEAEHIARTYHVKFDLKHTEDLCLALNAEA